MSSFIIDVINSSNEKGTINPDIGFSYSDKLNEMNEAEIRISGIGESLQGLIQLGSKVDIKRNGTREFYGVIDMIDSLSGGGFKIHITGYEIWLGRENGNYANSPWTSTASATIFGDLIAESNYFTADTVEAGLSLDFRASLTDSLWNAITNLRLKTGQDINIDYSPLPSANAEIDILDHKGSTTTVLTLNQGINMRNLLVSQGYPQGNDVRVYGKGDGANQIKSDHTTYGQDATSKSTYGTIRKIIVDKTVISQTEANQLADIMVAKLKNPLKIYSFDVDNPNESLVSGDVITLNANSQGLSNEEVRITEIIRGMISGQEFLKLEVANAAYSELTNRSEKEILKIKQMAILQGTHMQGSGNTLTWSNAYNAHSNLPLIINFQVSSNLCNDEAGNLRINSMTLDYDLDGYKRNFGTPSESSIAPNMESATVVSHNHSPADSGHTHTLPTTDTNATNLVTKYGSTLNYDENITTTWDSVTSHTITKDTEFLICTISLENSGAWSGTDTIGIRIDVGGTTYISDAGLAYNTADYSLLKTYIIPIAASLSSAAVIFYLYSNGNNEYSGSTSVHTCLRNHTHDITGASTNSGTAAVGSDNQAPGITGNAESHVHSVSIGDDITEDEALNSTEVDIYLDHYEGKTLAYGASAGVNKLIIMADTGNIAVDDVVKFEGLVSGNYFQGTVTAVNPDVSITIGVLDYDVNAGDLISWVTKYNILNTGKTIDTDVDISNSSAFPDIAGYWRIKIYPNSGNPDYAQGIVKIKHSLDN